MKKFLLIFLVSACATRLQVDNSKRRIAFENCTQQTADSSAFRVEKTNFLVKQKPVILLHAPLKSCDRPQITDVYVIPSRGMNVFRIRAWLPMNGEVELLFSQNLVEGENSLGPASDDEYGNLSFLQGGALLVPYANVIRGNLSPDRTHIETQILNKIVSLPANYSADYSGAEKASTHGRILNLDFTDLKMEATTMKATLAGRIHAGDFGVGWPSQTDLQIAMVLDQDAFTLNIVARNVGRENLPIAIGWHPYFRIQGKNREDARLFIPALKKAKTNNYENVFPTGELQDTKNTEFDFNERGKPLGSLYLDDAFAQLQRTYQGFTFAELTEPSVDFGLRIQALSPTIKVFQIYSPIKENYIAIEPQYNMADPYNKKIWKENVDTGIAVLKPGEKTFYSVKVELFSANSKSP